MTNRVFVLSLYRLFYAFLVVMMAARLAYSQEDSLKTEKADTSGIPLKYLVRPVQATGTISSNESYVIPDSVIRWSDYTYAGELLQKIPGAYLANMYQPGAPSDLSFDGLGSGYTKYLLDGVEMNEPTTSTLNLYQVPVEFASNVEYIDAVRAPIYQFNATGAVVNFQSQLYSESVPFSKVRHLEEPYNYLITDGVFSQNIGFNSNLDLGFEHQTGDGRFVNSVYDGVNIRGKYRYSIDSTRQITATEVYYRTKGGMTGGDLPYSITSAIFNPAYYTLARSQSANLTYLQHHIQVAYAQGDPHDSANVVTATAFFDYYSFQFGDVSLPYYLTNLSRRFGINLRGTESFVGTKLNFGAEALRDEAYYNSYADIPSRSRVSAYADEEFSLLNFVRAGVFGRGDLVGSKFYPALGASFGLGNETFSLEAGGSISSHTPSMSQMYFVTQDFRGNPYLVAETDKILQLKMAANFGSWFSLFVKPYARMIDKPIYYSADYSGQPIYPAISVANLGTRDIYGVDATMRIALWKFTVEGNFNYVSEKTDGNQVYTLPKYFASGELYYHDILFTGHLNLKFGLRGKVLSVFEGNDFYPQALIYVPTDINEFGPFGSTDFFVRGRVGDAVIYFTIFNITGENYVMAPVYPALDNSFCIGINWEFLN
jgi:outer membrane cobalamin receptor